MAGELIVSEVATPSTPASGKESVFVSNDATPHLKRVNSSGTVISALETGAAAVAGTTTVPPLQLTSGTNLTSPAAGSIEYDGTTFYATPVTSNRGVEGPIHFVMNSATQTGTNGGAAQPVFVTTLTSGAITLPATTAYIVTGVYNIVTSGTSSHSIGIGFGGTAGITSAMISYTSTNGTTGAVSAASTTLATGVGNTTVTAAVAAATNNTIIINGVIRISTTGTLIPQFTYSGSPGAAPTITSGTYLSLMPVGSNTVTNVGNWS